MSREERSQEEIIREQIEERLKQRDSFYIHVIAYIGIIPLLWLIWFITDTSFPWPLIPKFAWGLGVIGHGISYYNQYGAGRDKRQAFIDQQIRAEMDRRNYYKSKNDDFYDDTYQKIHLTEDGELSDQFADPYFDDDDHKRA